MYSRLACLARCIWSISVMEDASYGIPMSRASSAIEEGGTGNYLVGVG